MNTHIKFKNSAPLKSRETKTN